MKYAILDGQFQLHRSLYCPGADLVTSNGTPVGAIYVFLKMLWNFKEIGTPIVVFDSLGARSALRRELLPEYKVRPPAKTEEERLQKEESKKLLTYAYNSLRILLPRMGIPTVMVKDQEGDDVIFRLAEHFSAQGDEVWAVSDDKDYLQFLNLPKTFVYQPMKDKQFTPESFAAEYGFDVKSFILYKAMMGDPSDNIPGISGIGEKTATKIVQELKEPTIKALYEWSESGSKAAHKKVKDGFAIVKRNILLIDLNRMALTKEEVLNTYAESVANTKIEVQFIIDQFRKYEFNSLGHWLTYLLQKRNLSSLR